ncbi:MAG: hypothetical protein IKW96_05580 [Ruminococcus sp.]|uniref:hypothetical protein n=1 Tax=Ruminococcus sp. TaxID=41978 RepID=UPI0025F342A5|nr:hypothetical protein [Ruminococcus sp.]MBR5682736.1 hypothetical protein [Ruminococcus sp.]
MDKKKFFEAVSMIDDDLIKEAEISLAKLAKADHKGADDDMTVSGVEIYSNKIKWRRIAATAAVLVLAVGFGAAGYNVFKHRTPIVKEETELSTEGSTEAVTAEAATKESNDKKEEAVTTSKAEENKEKSMVTSAAEEKKGAEKPTSAADNGEKPVQATETAVQQAAPPSKTEKPKTTVKTTSKTTAKVTTKETTKRTEPVTTTTKPVITEKMDVFARLNELTYSPETCDGLPQYCLNAPGDTEVFAFNFSEKWVWRNSSTSNPVLEEADLPDDIIEYLRAHGEEIGMYIAQYSTPIPWQRYDFNAQYIRAHYFGDDYTSFPKRKVITSRAELDSYIEQNKGTFTLDNGQGSSVSFIDATAKYDDNWFNSHKLIIAVLRESSGSIGHEVVQVGGLNITIKRIVPQVGTDDMAYWHILIEVDKDKYVNSDFQICTYDEKQY